MSFHPRRAIITASNSGIGRATAAALARAGMDIGITWHSAEAAAQDTAAEIREAGVKAEVARLECVAPGEIATPMTGQDDHDPHAERRPGVPLGRPGGAREIAAVIAFLASAQASYVTGGAGLSTAGCSR
jgi:NAD(P)-dependent dehydrogenase (short-subunit alcohol dehydrogenase family)